MIADALDVRVVDSLNHVLQGTLHFETKASRILAGFWDFRDERRHTRQTGKRTERNRAERGLALNQTGADAENSDCLWLEVIEATEALAAKSNLMLSSRLAVARRDGAPPAGFDINRDVCPVLALSVWKDHKSFFQFSASRQEAQFGRFKESNGRIDIKTDDYGSVYMYCRGQTLETPDAVANFLMV